jgi:hypothetical protein
MNLTLKERLDLQRTARIITESQYNKLLKEEFLFEDVSDETIKQAVATALKISPEQVATQEPSEDETEVNEVALMTLITVAGLIPPALNLVAWISNGYKQKYGLNDKEKEQLAKLNIKILKKEELIKKLDKTDNRRETRERELLDELIKEKYKRFGSKFAAWAKHLAHDLHDKYTSPIRKFLEAIAWTAKKFGKKTRLQDEKFREKISNIIYAVTMFGIGGKGVFEHIGHLSGIVETAVTIADGVKAGKSVVDIVKDAALLI